MRRLTLAGMSAALVLVIVAGCGGGSATPSPSEAAETEAPIVTTAPAESSAAPVEETVAPSATGTVMYAVCGNVAVRKGPAADEGLVVRIAKGTKVRVVQTVTGTSYGATKCGESGDQWLKITRIAGKSVQKQYDVDAVYAAAGFFGEGQP
jgi:uncharacterized protein YgiM (DUF1202 family)